MKKVAALVKKTVINGCGTRCLNDRGTRYLDDRGTRCLDNATPPYLQNFELTSRTHRGHSVGIVRVRIKSH
jgi:hypothetical protein